MNNDDRIDEILRDAASEYNRPPATPRDEMWTAIQAAGEATAIGPKLHVSAGGAPASTHAAPLGGYSASHRSSQRYAWFGLAAAAVLLVATGVGIGRWTSATPEVRQIADAPAQTAPVVTGDGIVAPDSRNTPIESSSTPAPAEAQPDGGTSRPAATTRTPDEIRRNPIVTGGGRLRPVAPNNTTLASGNSNANPQVYQVATQEHLRDAEALLTSFSLESRDERMNTQFAGWAKGLLSNTRLLLDSPAGDDPRRARLLQDLELVLAQIVQLSPDAPAADRELVEGNIQNGLVMTRLRSAIPAGQPREITER